VETNLEQCPLCGTELSVIKFREIQSKLRQEEQRKAADVEQATATMRLRLEQKFNLDLEKQKKLAEKKAADEAAQEVRKVSAERDKASKKVLELEAREADVRKAAELQIAKHKEAAEHKANEEAGAKIKKATEERDLAKRKLKDAEDRETELKRAQHEAERQRQKDLSDQRQALEKDKTFALLKQQSEFNREREALQRKLQKKTANELGDGAEIDLFEALRGSFRGDDIRRIPKGQAGADILHEVLYKGESCGKIIVDSKNRQSWQNGFVTKLRQDQVEEGAEHSILATTVFPAGKRDLCVESGVIVIAPGGVVHMVQVLRKAMIAMRVMGLSMKERSSKMARLYELVRSESYSRRFSEAGRLAQDILELDVQEKKAHDNVWKKRGTLATRINHVLREVETDVAAVIEGGDDEESHPPFGVKSVQPSSAVARTQERM
jgi:hypothetical protein